MAKLLDKPITSADLDEYLGSYSDFSFELQVLEFLRSAKVTCEHGGLYEDPVTKKSREFDIRAELKLSACIVRLAIECKNLRANYPLLVSCVPRHPGESYHEVLLRQVKKQRASHYSVPAMEPHGIAIRIKGAYSRYEESAPVGKSLAQVGRMKDGLTSGDSEVFEKCSQALASADDLAGQCYEDLRERDSVVASALIPILVVPAGKLWVVEYGVSGSISANPHQVDHCSLYVGKPYRTDSLMGPSLTLSHLEIMTPSGLASLINSTVESPSEDRFLFSKKGIESALKEESSARSD